MSILVFIEQREGQVRPVSREVLGESTGLAPTLGGPVVGTSATRKPIPSSIPPRSMGLGPTTCAYSVTLRASLGPTPSRGAITIGRSATSPVAA